MSWNNMLSLNNNMSLSIENPIYRQMDTQRIPRKRENMGLFRCYKCGIIIPAKKTIFATILGQGRILYNYIGPEGITFFIKSGVKLECSKCYTTQAPKFS